MIFLLVPASVHSQLCFDFENPPLSIWKKSRDSAWDITGTASLCGSFSLWHCLDDSVSGEDRISFAYDSLVLAGSDTLLWQFMLRHAYLPSASNKWAVFLLSSRDEREMKPGGRTEAVLLGVNFAGSDDTLRLWKIINGEADVIATTNLNWQEEIGTKPAGLRVGREPGGKWSISVDRGGAYCSGMPAWEPVGKGVDTMSVRPDFFGIYYRFSSRQDRQFWFDHLSVQGTFIRDTIPPAITGIGLPDERTIRLSFSEPPDLSHALYAGNYVVLPGGTIPRQVLPVNESTLDLIFRDPFLPGTAQILQAFDLKDRRGNASGILEAVFTWYKPLPGDVIFNEIMYDPIPGIGLPEYEYLELYNRSGFAVEMGDWILQVGEKQLVMPDFSLPGGECLLLCYRGTHDLYGEALRARDILTAKTLFPNEGTLLMLLDPDSVVIDWMEYSDGLHKNEYYAEGGWSLERIDPGRACQGRDNWTTSSGRRGGTPGTKNAVLAACPDRTSPEILSVFLPDAHSITIEFSETMDRHTVLKRDAWTVNRGMGEPDSTILRSPQDRVLTLRYDAALEPGRDYCLEVRTGIMDCSGNELTPGRKVRFALPVPPVRSEILLSEILFNPWPYCPDFIEVCNRGSHTFDLNDLRLANRDPESGEIVSAGRIVDGHRLFYPGEYLVLTPDPEVLSGFYTVYDPLTLVRVSTMPKMGDVEGSVLVLDTYLEVIDEMNYHRDMHHPLLDSQEGVSLERISFETGAQCRANWHSASSAEGWGTPGRRNSQFREELSSGEGFEVDPEIFTPDMDGVDDVLLIRYRFQSPGLSARILVFDPRGRLIREIASRALLATEGFYVWDGTDREGERARAGMYLIFAEVGGKGAGIRRYRKTCVLSTGR